MLKGLINVNKQAGMTSSDVVVKIKRLLGQKSVGHMGTLDPMGEGVLLVGVGKATRLFDHLLKKDKVYEADFVFGYQTDTLDTQGKITHQSGIVPALNDINNALSAFVGEIEQIPPMYSAKSIGGVRAYSLARQGIEVELKPSTVNIYSITVLGYNSNTLRLQIHCSSGTYIRSIGRDLAFKLGSYATMSYIKRTRCGEFLLNDAVTLDQLANDCENTILPLDKVLKHEQRLLLGEEFRLRLDHGIKLPLDSIHEHLNGIDLSKNVVVYCGGDLYGIAHSDGARMVIHCYLRD